MMHTILIHLLSFWTIVTATNSACAQIAAQISGNVYYATSLSANYHSDIEHYMTSSTETPACVVEVASAEDVSKVIKIVGSTQTPFGVKCGGHASNPGFSSTPGVHISLARLKSVSVSSDKSSVTFGTGNLWSDVYKALDGKGINVVGGRVSGPGTAGFALGGGYSWITNQYGLTCDTVQSYKLVLPNGTITTVNAATPDLNFALKGGLNRFGIVTEMTLDAHPQGDVYAGIAEYGGDQIPALIKATDTFQKTNTDPKAQVILTLNGGPVGVSAILLSFYDGPSKPAAFAPFDAAIPLLSTVKSQSFYEFSQSVPSQLSGGNRGAFHTLMTTTLTQGFMNAVYNETKYYSTLALAGGASLLSYDLEPFNDDYGKHAVDSAFPHASSPLPLNLYFAWSSLEPFQDDFWRTKMQESVDHLTRVAMAEGIYAGDPVYPNYALSTYSGAQLYGATNAARLRAIQAAVDPNGVMELAGGFSF